MLAASLSLALLQTPPATAPPAPATEPEPASPAPATAPAPPPTPPPADAYAQFAGQQTPSAPPPAYDPSPPPFANRPPPATSRELPEELTHRKLVFQNTYAVNFGLFYIPSGDFSFFLGSNLKPRKNLARTFDWHTALGYQLTLSVGLADALSSSAFFGGASADSIFYQRHHFTAVGHGGPYQRFYYSAGGGVWMRGSMLVGIEVEGKIGGRFATREDSRVSGIAGGQFRLGGSLEQGYPFPQFGLFLGFMAF